MLVKNTEEGILMKTIALKMAGMALLVVGMSVVCAAAIPVEAPEIDASTAGSAIALLGGAIMMIRARKR